MLSLTDTRRTVSYCSLSSETLVVSLRKKVIQA